MATLMMMPAIATGDEGATLASWEVQVGSPFKATDTVAVIETAKAAVEVEAEQDGVILQFLVEEGSDVPVGNPIALVGAPGETVADLPATLAELGLADGVVGLEPPVAAQPETVAPPAELSAAEPTAAGGGTSPRIFASPLARRLARDSGLRLEDIVGTGPNGRIRRDDVLEMRKREVAEQPSPAPPDEADAGGPAATASTPEPVDGFIDIPHSRLRRTIARRLTESVTTAPHFILSGVATADRLLAMRAELNASTGVRVTVNDLIVKAVAVAHSAVPDMNVVWLDDAVRRFDAVDVGMAVNTPTGLVAPVVRGVDRLGIGQLSVATADLAAKARSGRLRQDDLEGGSISVSNLGSFGTRSFSAIINPPHAAILAVGAAAAEPVVVDGALAVAKRLHLNVSVDHRPVDGATAAEWMAALVEALEHPLRLLI